MKSIRIKCPAKINLTLEVLNKREDGFHNIKSIMQLVSLYDFLDINVEKSGSNLIKLSGLNSGIPYDKTNLVYKAADLFLNTLELSGYNVSINIEKNIPIAAGLAGGSTDAAGTLFGLNEIFENPLNNKELHELCAQLGSDLNVCLEGGCLLATSRGEKIQKLKTIDMSVTLIKPKNLGISAKEAYTKFSAKEHEPCKDMTEKMIYAINSAHDIREYLYNDLEHAVFDDYAELQFIKSRLPYSIMSGSGPTYFTLENTNKSFPSEYELIRDLKFIQSGVSIA